jgi:hypothetical protein
MKRSVIWVAAVIAIAVTNNLVSSSLLGLGDAEALYYCYGRYPSLSYLDHPPLIGWLIFISTELGGSNVLAVRAVSMVMTALAVIFTYLLTRDIYGGRAGAWSALLMISTPVFSIGMTAATPDAPLVALWSLFTWQFHSALADDRDGPWTRIGRPVFLGLVVGLAFLAKYTGACLVLTVLTAALAKRNRAWLRRPGFWLGALAALLISTPVLIWNMEHGFASLLHRLIWTQEDAGISLENLGALVGGQLLYVGPFMLPLFAWACIRIFKNRAQNTDRLSLLFASLPALALTYVLALWSRVAEPHWPAVGYIPLFAAASGLIIELEGKARVLARYAVVFGLGLLLLANVLVLTPILPMLSPKDSYRPEYDLGNELRGWAEVAETLRQIDTDSKPVIAAFYTQCSQLKFALSKADDPEVQCVSPNTDDFDFWDGRFALPETGAFFVTDNRFEHDPEKMVHGAVVAEPVTILEITRGGRWVRRFKIFRLARQAAKRSL